MSHSPNLFPLKLLVISLGVLLVGAIVFVLGTITSRMQEGSNSHCKDATVSIGSIGALAGVTPQGNNVELTLKDGRNVKLVTVDKCTGAILHTLTVAP